MAARPLKIGLQIPHWEYGLAGVTASGAELLALARQAEAVGFDGVWVADHALALDGELYEALGRPIPPELAGETPSGFWDGWTLLTAMAMVTGRLELGMLVACTNYRHPALIAKTADTLDELSGGRVILGLGAGDSRFEHRALGLPTDHLVGRFEEALTIVRAVFRGEPVEFAGNYFSVNGFALKPRGPRPSGPPIVIGTLAKGPRMLRLTAQFADITDAWVVFQRSSPEIVPPMRDRIDAACRVLGRDPATLERSLSVQVAAPGQHFPGTEAISGSPEEIAATLRAFAAEGIARVQISFAPFTPAMVEEFGAVLALLDRG